MGGGGVMSSQGLVRLNPDIGVAVNQVEGDGDIDEDLTQGV